MDKIIGGEFAIDLNNFILYEKNFKEDYRMNIPYSSGRHALYMILKDIDEKLGKDSEVFIPNYLCDSITKTIVDAGWNYKFYSIDRDLYPNIQEILTHKMDNNVVILLINYFGMVNLEEIVSNIKRNIPSAIVIIDNVQAFYERKIDRADYTFVSYRKWFPCPDGADVIKRNGESMLEFPFGGGYNTFSQYKFAGNVLKNFTVYLDDTISLKLLKEGEDILNKEYLCNCSKITARILSTLDLENISVVRKNNARVLHENLQRMNIAHAYNENAVPFFIPIFIQNRDNIRKHFFENKIFTPKHWPFLSKKYNGDSSLYNTELSLICDQRYNEDDMMFQINVLRQAI